MRQKDNQGYVCRVKGLEFYFVEYGLFLKNFKQVIDVIRIVLCKNIILVF